MPYHDLDTNEVFLTLAEAARLLKVPTPRVHKWIEEGRLEATDLNDDKGTVYIAESNLEELAAELAESRSAKQEARANANSERDDRELSRQQELAAIQNDRTRLKDLNNEQFERELIRRRLERIDEQASTDMLTVGLGIALAAYLAVQIKKRNENGAQ